jgi:hypothetical protein
MLVRIESQLEATRENLFLLRKDFGDEKDHAHESRAVIHRRLDDQAQQIGKIETTVAISGQVEAQLRDKIGTLTKTVDDNYKAVTPALDEWKRMKTLGVGIAGLIAMSGLTIGVIASWASDTVSTALRHWLKIN